MVSSSQSGRVHCFKASHNKTADINPTRVCSECAALKGILKPGAECLGNMAVQVLPKGGGHGALKHRQIFMSISLSLSVSGDDPLVLLLLFLFML